jgi:hypothetical protein
MSRSGVEIEARRAEQSVPEVARGDEPREVGHVGRTEIHATEPDEPLAGDDGERVELHARGDAHAVDVADRRFVEPLAARLPEQHQRGQRGGLVSHGEFDGLDVAVQQLAQVGALEGLVWRCTRGARAARRCRS